jgi:hypothetical protein
MAGIMCDICAGRFADEEQLARHRRDQHARIELEPGMNEQRDGQHSGTIICAICRADFIHFVELTAHVEREHPELLRKAA